MIDWFKKALGKSPSEEVMKAAAFAASDPLRDAIVARRVLRTSSPTSLEQLSAALYQAAVARGIELRNVEFVAATASLHFDFGEATTAVEAEQLLDDVKAVLPVGIALNWHRFGKPPAVEVDPRTFAELKAEFDKTCDEVEERLK